MHTYKCSTEGNISKVLQMHCVQTASCAMLFSCVSNTGAFDRFLVQVRVWLQASDVLSDLFPLILASGKELRAPGWCCWLSHVIFTRQPENAGTGQSGAAFPQFNIKQIVDLQFSFQIWCSDWLVQFNSVQPFLYSAFNNGHRHEAALQKSG